MTQADGEDSTDVFAHLIEIEMQALDIGEAVDALMLIKDEIEVEQVRSAVSGLTGTLFEKAGRLSKETTAAFGAWRALKAA